MNIQWWKTLNHHLKGLEHPAGWILLLLLFILFLFTTDTQETKGQRVPRILGTTQASKFVSTDYEFDFLPVRASCLPNFGVLQRLQSDRRAQLTLPQLWKNIYYNHSNKNNNNNMWVNKACFGNRWNGCTVHFFCWKGGRYTFGNYSKQIVDSIKHCEKRLPLK